ncbi:MAG: aldo/keto reductase [Alphaproteobacteria bacterium]
MAKLGLGSVQFGLDYGISNQSGQTSAAEVRQIIDLAASNGIEVVDTASLYGGSEEVLGASIPAPCPFQIVTKTLTFGKERIGDGDCDAFKTGVEQSFLRLRQDRLYGLMAHNAGDLYAEGGQQLFDIMRGYRDMGVISKIGASVYDGGQIDTLLAQYGDDIDLVQLPLSILDQRLLHSGHLSGLKKRGIEIHVRSAFLQGAALMAVDDLPGHLAGLKQTIIELESAAQERETSRLALALSFLMRNDDIDAVVCGVNTAAQLGELCSAVKALPALSESEFSQFAVSDPMLVNPHNWG